MLAIVALGTGIALLEPKLLWLNLIYGALASAGLFPILFALLHKKIPPLAIGVGISTSLLIATPLSIYANIMQDQTLVVLAAVLGIGCGLMACVGGVLLSSLSSHERRKGKGEAPGS